MQISKSANYAYVRKYVLPRVFLLFDTKKDGAIDFDEYLCAVALFRAGTVEDKIKCSFTVFCMMLFNLHPFFYSPLSLIRW